MSADPLVAYARSRDVGYPPSTQYADVILACSQELREPLLAIYAVLHMADDIADDPAATPAERRARFDGFLAAFRRVVVDGAAASSDPCEAAFERLARAHARHAVASFAAYEPVFAALRAMIDWPPHPHFPDAFALAVYIREKFSAIVEVFAPFVLAAFAGRAHELLVDEFVHLMLAMHAVNMLMDLEEDARAGQYWFPVPHCVASGAPTAAFARELIRDGHHHLACARHLRSAFVVGEPVAALFTGLAGIFEKLSVEVAARLSLGPVTPAPG